MREYYCFDFGRPFDGIWIRAASAKLAKREASKRKGWPIERITARRELPELR